MTTIETPESRRASRRKILQTGLIRSDDLSMCCVIRNFSDVGAALDVGPQDILPNQFVLIVVSKKKTYSCNVVWRKGTRIGVSFV
jgi:hypothetical protein